MAQVKFEVETDSSVYGVWLSDPNKGIVVLNGLSPANPLTRTLTSNPINYRLECIFFGDSGTYLRLFAKQGQNPRKKVTGGRIGNRLKRAVISGGFIIN